MNTLTRRRFLATAVALSAMRPDAFVSAVEPVARRGAARLRLSLAAYSFRDYFAEGRGGGENKPAERRMDMKRFIDFCGEHGCEGAELTSYYFPEDVTDEQLLDVRRHAYLAGVAVSGTAVGNTFTLPPGERRDREIAHVKEWIRRARVLGAPHIRVFAGNAEGQPRERAMRQCIEALEECAAEAGRAGIFLGLENHGGIVAEPGELLEIVRAVRSPWVGINLDTGNFHTADPYADLEKCLPYAVNVQVKVEIRRRGGSAEPADLSRITRMLRDAGYQGWVVLEYEARPDPWTAVPEHLAELRERIAART